ncbi:unnamed protein product [Blepharisma stoltei]|uniref:RAP domain-containing protein n=1 Tax=Blepharisma stoltei TaxID=1481888 RepID=A0AAU9IVB4_9CILI|nr:unnamed protein product [Blepharisma stoltei]
MAKSLGKLIQAFKNVTDPSQAVEILNEAQFDKLKKYPNEGMELIRLACTNFSRNKDVFQVLESPKYLNAYSGAAFSYYLQNLTYNKKTSMSPQFYALLEEKIVKMPPDKLSWKLVQNAFKIFGRYCIIPSFSYISKLEEVIINNSEQFSLAEYSVIVNFYANFRLLENPEHKNPDRFRKVMLTKKNFSQHDLEKESAMNSLIGLTKSLVFLKHLQDTDLWTNNFKMLAYVYPKCHHDYTPWRIYTDMSIFQIIDAHQTFAPENMGKYVEFLRKITAKCHYDPKNLKTQNLVSPLEISIKEIFKKYSLKYEFDKIISNYYIADYFLEPNIAIEIDGPRHFIRKYNDSSFKLLRGKAVYKTDLMSAKGYKVIRVPCFADDIEAYLINELKNIGVDVASSK